MRIFLRLERDIDRRASEGESPRVDYLVLSGAIASFRSFLEPLISYEMMSILGVITIEKEVLRLCLSFEIHFCVQPA